VSTHGVRIAESEGDAEPDVLALLVHLALEDQEHYDHPRETPDQIAERLHARPRFTGENHIMVARDEAGAAVGLCWVALFDPGTGLEAEIAELYVEPAWRGRGVATQLVAAAMELIKRRQVTFASVWTRDDNAAALAAYRAAGFAASKQTVLTWLPLEPEDNAQT
jgi:ribosomal protein S18 acetylase RimI-like enzyme